MAASRGRRGAAVGGLLGCVIDGCGLIIELGGSNILARLRSDTIGGTVSVFADDDVSEANGPAAVDSTDVASNDPANDSAANGPADVAAEAAAHSDRASGGILFECSSQGRDEPGYADGVQDDA